MKNIIQLVCFIFVFFPVTGMAADQNPLQGFSRGKVIFTFDDVYQSVYDYALPVLAQNQMPATVYVATEWASNDNPIYMKWPALQEVVSRYGWEVGGHTVTHPLLEQQTPERIEQEIKGSKLALEAQGFHPLSFAVPYGSYNNTTLSLIHKYYQNNRGFWTSDPLATNELQDHLNLPMKQVANTTTVDEIKSWVNRAALESKTLILVFHIIDPQSPASNRWGFGIGQFQDVVNYVAQKREEGVIDVTTVKKALEVPGKVVVSRKAPLSQISLTSTSHTHSLRLPRFRVNPTKAYLIKLFVDAKALTPQSRFNLFIEETHKSGETTLIPFLESQPSTYLLAKTYLPSLDTTRARLLWKLVPNSSGILQWEDFQVVEMGRLQER